MTVVSIVIPTRGRVEALAACLDAVAAQRGCPPFEVVVVDDGTEGARRIAAAAGARTVEGGGRGAAAARNAGVAASRGELVLFTDDDCVPAPGWAAALAARLQAGADVVGGRTLNGAPGDPFATASETVREHLEDWQARSGRVPFAASNNLGCMRALVVAVPFDESYVGAGGEDRDWSERVGAIGARFERVEGALVLHRQSLDLRAFLRQHVRYGRGARRFGAGRPGRRKLQSPAFYATLLRRGLGHGPAAGILVALAQVATAVGYVAEAIYRE